MYRLFQLGVVALGAVLVLAGSASAQTPTGDYSAAIHAGMCAELDEEVVSLNAPAPEGGDSIGVEDLAVVLESDNDDIAGVTGVQLTGSPHSVVVFSGEDVVACGEIGGSIDDEDLIIGIHPEGDSGYFGIADFDDIVEESDDDDDDDNEVDVELYVVEPAA